MICGVQKSSITFAVSAVILFVSVLYGGCSIGVQRASSMGKPEIVKEVGWTEIGDDIYVFTSDFYLANSVLLTSKNEAVLIDTGMNEDDKQKIQNFLKEKKLKLKNIIITHMHDDHTANMQALKTEGMEPVTPKNAKDAQTIAFGDTTLKIVFTEGHYAPKGHLSVEVVEKNILIAGDVFCNNILPPIASGGNLEALLETLKRLEAENYSVIVPGHGEVIDSKVIFERQFEYLENAREQIERIIAAEGNIWDLSEIKLEDCIKDTSYLYEEQLDYWHKNCLETIYLQLKKK